MPTKSKITPKYACPNCGGRLYAWVEEVVEHQANIDPKTGKMTKKITKEHIGNATENYGISCAAGCGSIYTRGGQDIPDYFFDGLAGKGFERLFNSAK